RRGGCPRPARSARSRPAGRSPRRRCRRRRSGAPTRAARRRRTPRVSRPRRAPRRRRRRSPGSPLGSAGTGGAPACRSLARAALGGFLLFLLVVLVLVLIGAGEGVEHVLRAVLDPFERALGLVLRTALGDLLHHPGQAGDLVVRLQIEPVDRLGEAQVGVHAGDDDAGVDGQQLDPDHGDPDVGVDHEALVQDDLENVGQTARSGSPVDSLCDGHGFLSMSARSSAASNGKVGPEPTPKVSRNSSNFSSNASSACPSCSTSSADNPPVSTRRSAWRSSSWRTRSSTATIRPPSPLPTSSASASSRNGLLPRGAVIVLPP